MSTCRQRVEEELMDYARKAKEFWHTWKSADALDDVLDFSTYEALVSLREESFKATSMEELDAIRLQHTNFFSRWINRDSTRQEVRTFILGKLKAVFMVKLEAKADAVVNRLGDGLNEHLSRVSERLKEAQDGQLRHKEDLLAGKNDRDKEITSITEQIRVKQECLAMLGSLDASLDQSLRDEG